MKYTHMFRHLAYKVIAVSVLFPVMSTNAQSAEFADDFSSDSIRFSAASFNGPNSDYSVTPVADGLQLSTNVDQANETGSALIRVNDKSDSFGMKFTHLSSSSIDSGFVNAFLEATIYSDTPDSSNRNGEGDVQANITFGYGADRLLGVFHCMSRRDANGDPVQIPGTCDQFSGINASFDQSYALSIAIDRDANQLVFSVDDVEKRFGLPENIYQPSDHFRRIQLYHDNGTGTSNGTIQSVTLGNETIDMASNPPVLDRYQTNFETGTSANVIDEKLAVTAFSDANSDQWADAELYIQSPTDYLEGEVTLSSESDVSMPEYRAYAGMQLEIFNTLTDNATNSYEGDVRAEIALEARGDGLRRVEICLFRYEDANGDNRTGLLDPEDDNNRCETLPLRFEFDTTYRLAMGVDRDASTFTFRVGGYTKVVQLEGNLFAASRPTSRVSIAGRNDGVAVGTIDNIRTAPNALSSTEIANNATTPPSFPDPVDPASLQEDSTIAYPFDFLNYQPQLNFVDDFSGITTDFGFWSGRDRGDSGVSWSNGAVILETNSAEGNDDGNWTEFYLNPRTDSVEAVVSLSSESRIPPGNTGAEIGIRAIFYNDTQDYGFNDQEGDVEAAIQLQSEGDGRKRLRVRLRRRDAGGRSGDNILEEEFSQQLLTTTPELDRPYKFSLAINRDTGVIQFGVDEQTAEYQIPTGVFLPARSRALISVNHYRGSGVAVGRIHSVKTDTIDEDFSISAPQLAPYSPMWNSQRGGRLSQVVDGRLQLEADGTLSSGSDPGLQSISASDYVGASIELSSDSSIQAEGRVHVEVHAILYNDLPGDPPTDGNEGRVFSAVRLTADANGERFVQHCAYRSNDEDFEDSTELFGGDDDNCPRFSFTPEFNTPYEAFIKLDREAATLTFGFNGETIVYNIQTSISETRPFNGVRARTTDNSKVVAWVDNLAFAENPVALADSSNSLVPDVGSGNTNGTDSNTDVSQESDNSSGGGTAGISLFSLLLLPALRLFRFRKSNTTCSRIAKRPLSELMLLSSLVVLNGCATTSTTTQPDSIPLSSNEVLAHITDRTETWSSGGAYYAPDGVLETVWENVNQSGSWRVTDDGQVCMIAPPWAPEEECHSYALINDEVHLVYNHIPTLREVLDGNQLENFK